MVAVAAVVVVAVVVAVAAVDVVVVVDPDAQVAVVTADWLDRTWAAIVQASALGHGIDARHCASCSSVVLTERWEIAGQQCVPPGVDPVVEPAIDLTYWTCPVCHSTRADERPCAHTAPTTIKICRPRDSYEVHVHHPQRTERVAEYTAADHGGLQAAFRAAEKEHG